MEVDCEKGACCETDSSGENQVPHEQCLVLDERRIEVDIGCVLKDSPDACCRHRDEDGEYDGEAGRHLNWRKDVKFDGDQHTGGEDGEIRGQVSERVR